MYFFFLKTKFSNFGNVAWEKLKGILDNRKVSEHNLKIEHFHISL